MKVTTTPTIPSFLPASDFTTFSNIWKKLVMFENKNSWIHIDELGPWHCSVATEKTLWIYGVELHVWLFCIMLLVSKPSLHLSGLDLLLDFYQSKILKFFLGSSKMDEESQGVLIRPMTFLRKVSQIHEENYHHHYSLFSELGPICNGNVWMLEQCHPVISA